MIFAVSRVDADATVVVKVVPASQTVRGGENFSVNVTIENVTNMDADQARLFFDPSAMNATEGIEGEFLQSGGSTVGFPSIINNIEGFAGFAFMLLEGTPVTGSGVLATMNFNTSDDIEGAFNLNFADVMIGTTAGYVPVDTYNGTISIDNTPPIISIQSPKEGGNYSSVSVRLNFTAEDLRSGVNETAYNLDGTGNITIAGNTTVRGLAPYDHSIIVYAWDKVDEFGYCEVQFTVHPGDISDDLKVNIVDLAYLADVFLSQSGDPDWNENADLNCDDTVNVHDLVIMANYFFTSYS